MQGRGHGAAPGSTTQPTTGMVIDLGLFERALEQIRDVLDHRFLDEVPDLGPATIENLSAWIGIASRIVARGW